MATTITSRVSGAITESTTKRVGSDSFDPAIYDVWGNSWGPHGNSSWGSSWLVKQSLSSIGHTARVGENPIGEQTSRVGENPSGGQISRVHHLLLLEGDESGYLLLEGDAQTGTDKLEFEGDETAIGSTITKRVGTLA